MQSEFAARELTSFPGLSLCCGEKPWERGCSGTLTFLTLKFQAGTHVFLIPFILKNSVSVFKKLILSVFQFMGMTS